MNNLKLISLLSLVLSLSACNTVHTDTDLSFKADQKVISSTEVKIYETDLPSDTYTYVGEVKGHVNKVTIFDKNPTKEQAEELLRQKAQAAGADAVINATFDKGLFGLIKAKGQAVKLN